MPLYGAEAREACTRHDNKLKEIMKNDLLGFVKLLYQDGGCKTMFDLADWVDNTYPYAYHRTRRKFVRKAWKLLRRAIR